jgi:anti-anti-sigma factor
MTARVETFKGCKILRTAGRIDFESALDFEQSVNAMLQSAENRFIIELSEVELLSSAGLRVLLSAVKRATHRQARFALAAPSLVVRQVFEISHFDLLFKIYPTLSEAVNALGGAGETAVEIETPPAAAPVRPKPPVVDRPATFNRPVVPDRPVQSSESPTEEPVPPPVKTPTFAPPVVPLPSTPAPPEPKVDQVPETPSAIETAVPPVAEQPRVSPPPLPPVLPSLSAPRPTSPPPQNASRPPNPASSRREATFPSVLEVRAEGVSYACKDGDVIGKGGQVARSFFDQIPGLEPRHLLIGQMEGRWFVFTPKTVIHPFTFDGVPLASGERRPLAYVEHQMEFHGYVFGLRLVPESRKAGFFARLFGKK